MRKGSIQQEDRAFVGIYAPNTGEPKYREQILTDLKGKMICNIVIAGVFNIPLTSMNRSSRQKIN